MTRADLHQLEALMDEMVERIAEQRAHLVTSDSSTDSVARHVARERAARCERRLVILDRLLKHHAV